MTADWNSFIDNLSASDEIEHAGRKASTEQKFPCPSCAGTGLYTGARVHQEKSHCFACKGLGYFKTDPRKLAANRAKAQVKKADIYAAFHEANADLIRTISKYAEWSDFARALADQLASLKPWSENQIAAAQRLVAKVEASRAAKAAARPTAKADLTAIRAMFEAASQNGYKKPVYRAEGLALSLAPSHGRNPGAIYVKRIEDDAYLGKVIGTEFQPSRDAGAAIAAALATISSDPKAAAVAYGRKTGTCSCCGRRLDNALSIELGIGPICRDKWGL